MVHDSDEMHGFIAVQEIQIVNICDEVVLNFVHVFVSEFQQLDRRGMG